MMNVLRRLFVLSLSVFILGPVALSAPFAEANAAYGAQMTHLTDNGGITMTPGARKTVDITFKNTGTAVWSNDGPGYISAYTFEPRYRRSVFDSGKWIWWNQLKRINETRVAPGEQATMSFEIHAPKELGTYTEVFHLASEDRAWISGGKITLTIHVRAEAPVAEAPVTQPVPVPVTLEKSKAAVTAQTIYAVRAEAGSPLHVQVALQNMGTNTWSGFGLLAPEGSSSVHAAHVRDASWTATHIARSAQEVKPGETGVLAFTVRAPRHNGVHNPLFEIVTDEGRRTGAFVDLSVTVTNGSNEAPPVADQTDASGANYIEEPTLRIGVLIVDEETDDEVRIRSNTSRLRIETTSGAELAVVEQGVAVWGAYQNGVYAFDAGLGRQTSTEPIRFVPDSEMDVLEIINFDRRVTRRSAFADNTFRGPLELRHNTSRNRVWLINEVPLEIYMRGLAETSNASHIEFQKTMIIAARTFVFHHHTREEKWEREHFDVTAYSYDQIYNGYEHEMRSPNIVKAVEETRGVVVTYEGELAVTPYFSRSDGRTRNWSDVWNGDRPWARSVAVPCDQGRTMLGHGVGMSAQGAICMANGGQTAEEILKHFYTGIELTPRWK